MSAAGIPQMAIEERRLYGEAFLALEEFERQVKELAELGDRAASPARDGLTSGAPRPPARQLIGRNGLGVPLHDTCNDRITLHIPL